MTSPRKPKDRDGFHIAIICALTRERDTVMEMLDESWDATRYRKAPGDRNIYRMGRIGLHNVVVAQLPGMGIQEAASAATSFRLSFRNISLGLVVGVCGGLPTKTDSGDILLGDVVLSREIVDYTFGAQYDNHFVPKDTLADRFGRPDKEIRAFLKTMEGKRDRSRLKTNSATYLMKLCQKAEFASSQFPGNDKDIVYPRQYRHKHQQPEACACVTCQMAEDALAKARIAGKPEEEVEKMEDNVRRAIVCDPSAKMSCEELKCDKTKGTSRQCPDRAFIKGTAIRELEIHIGVVGSSNSVLKSSYHRDELATARKIIAFEMEGAGVWDTFPTIVVKGVCDYADGHKSKDWQYYAAASAAACMKSLLMEWPASDDPPPCLVEARSKLPAESSMPSRYDPLLIECDISHKSIDRYTSFEREQMCHRLFKTTDYRGYKDANCDCHPGTCKWAIHDPQFQKWQQDPRCSLLWISAGPNCGKSVLSRHLLDSDLLAAGQNSVLYFFFRRDNHEQNNLATALCAILHQLFAGQPELLRHAVRSWIINGDRISRELSELWLILCAAASDPACRPIICVFDAIDECSRDDCRQLIRMFRRFCVPPSPLCEQGSSTLKLLVTSRVSEDLEYYLQPSIREELCLRLRGEHKSDQIREDIKMVIETHVHQLSGEFGLSDHSQEQLHNHFVNMQHRTYLGLDLRIEEIRLAYQESSHPGEVQLEKLPSRIIDLYEHKLGKITERPKPEARAILLLVLAACRPFTVQALDAAMSLVKDKMPRLPVSVNEYDHLKRYVGHCCGHVIDVGGSYVYLIDKSIREFLLYPDQKSSYEQIRTSTCSWKHSLSMVDAHRLLAAVCQKALSTLRGTSPTITESVILNGKGSLEEYAFQYGIYHVKEALECMHTLRRAFFIERMSGFGFDLQTVDSAGKSLLHHMIGLSHSDVDYALIKFILNQNGLVQSADRDNMNCLQYAVLRHDDKLLDILLKAGFAIDRAVQRKGRHDAALMEERAGLTALHAAALFSRYRSVLRLIKHKAVVTLPNQYGQTALHLAVGSLKQQRGHLGDMWEEHEIMAGHVWDFDDEDEIRVATEIEYKWRTRVVLDLCNASSAIVNAKDNDGQTPLHVVSYSQHSQLTFELVMTLLKHGADRRTRDNNGNLPIHGAARYANVNCLQLLLDRDEDLSITDNHGRNTLHFAAQSGCKRTVEFVLSRIPSGNIRQSVDCHGQDALQIALHDQTRPDFLHFASKEIVETLLKAGCRASRTNYYKQDALAHYITNVTFSVRPEIVAMLLKNGANPFFRNAEGCNLAHLLLSGENAADMHSLLALQHSGVCLSDLDYKRRSVLHHAAIAGSVTKSLLCHLSYCIGLSINSRDACLRTAMDYAYEEKAKKRSINLWRSNRWAATVACFKDMANISAVCVCRDMVRTSSNVQ